MFARASGEDGPGGLAVGKRREKRMLGLRGDRALAESREARNALWVVLLAIAAAVCAGHFAHGQTPLAPAAPTPAAEAPPAIPVEPAAADTSASSDAASSPSMIARNLLAVLRDGGPLMIPIGICSLVLVVFILERLISLRSGVVIPGAFVERFLTQLREGELDREDALQLCDENKSPVADIFAAAVKKWGRTGVEIEQAIIDEGERVTQGMRAYLRWFNGIAQISPLLGLLGTVFGMISSFHGVGAGGIGRGSALAGGIAEALITTAAGLIVAIPALSAYLYFGSRVDALVMEMDNLSQQVVEAIASDSEPRSTPKRSSGEKAEKGEKQEKRKAA